MSTSESALVPVTQEATLRAERDAARALLTQWYAATEVAPGYSWDGRIYVARVGAQLVDDTRAVVLAPEQPHPAGAPCPDCAHPVAVCDHYPEAKP